MTTIARQANIRIADRTAALAQLVINAKFAAIIADNFPTTETPAYDFYCALCPFGTDNPAEIFTRIDNRDGAEIECCEHCADHADVSYIAD